MKARKMIAVRVFGQWTIVDPRCLREHGPLNVCARCVA